MDWLLGTTQQGVHTKFLMCSHDGQIDCVDAASLKKHGLPQAQHTERVVFTGQLSAWTRGSSKRYLQAFGIKLPAGQSSDHSVFVQPLDPDTCLHVPALAFIRGLFKPHQLLLPVMFTPCSIDLLGYVDFGTQPPVVVLDSQPSRYAKLADGDSLAEPLRWAHTSRSGKQSAQSVHGHGRCGCIDLKLPRGEFRLVMHGVRQGKDLFVTQLTVISIQVAASDSITEREEVFIYHRMASKARKVTTLKDFPAIPLRPGQQTALTDAEWQKIEGLLVSPKRRACRYCRRYLLDLMLEKLSSQVSWEAIAQRSGVPEVNLTTTFRRWDLSGQLLKVLQVLTQMRLV